VKKSKAITEADTKIIEGWFSEAKKCANVGQVSDFIGRLITDYSHDYGTIVKAITAAALAGMYCVEHSPQGGITGFQASCVFWEFVQRWDVFSKGPKRMMQYENMLYPQYEDKFQKTITPDTWKWLQGEAKKHLAEREDGVLPHIDVMNHWKAIADGQVPFGYEVRAD
jgi:hypothetical protein